MTSRTLTKRSLRFHWRSHLGVVLGAAIGSAALIGALIVGDSVKGSLRERALGRLLGSYFALNTGDRLISSDLGEEIRCQHIDGWGSSDQHFCNYVSLFIPILHSSGTAQSSDASARANEIHVYGIQFDPSDLHSLWRPNWSRWQGYSIAPGDVWLNEALANKLNVRERDDVILRVKKTSGLPGESPISQRVTDAVAMRLRVRGILDSETTGTLSLQSQGTQPLNAFLNLSQLQVAVAGRSNVVNLLLTEGPWRGDSIATPTRDHLVRRAQSLGSDSLAKLVFRLGSSDAQPCITSEAQSYLKRDLQTSLSLDDLETNLRLKEAAMELSSRRVFLDAALVAAAFSNFHGTVTIGRNNKGEDEKDVLAPQTTNAQPLLTYLANLITVGTNATPYSMVTAAGAPWTPPDLRDDEIVINQWLADDLHARPGDALTLVHFDPESGARLTERTNTFRVHSIVPMEMPWADRTLMPQFPGLEKAETTAEWDTAFPLVHKIRPQDDDYWRDHRGTPKAFITLAAGQKMWANRFGNLTAIRFSIPPNFGEHVEGRAGSPLPAEATTVTNGAHGVTRPTSAETFRAALEEKILATLKPEELGLHFEPVREQALKAAEQSQDFGGLFIGFSLFVIVAALLLMALLFQFSLEQRAAELGTLLALGFTPKQVRRLFLREGVALSFIGGILGTLGGIGYARAMLHGLSTIWRDAVGASTLKFFVTPQTLLIGLLASTIVAAFTLWFALRKHAKQPARVLLAGEQAGSETKGGEIKQGRGLLFAVFAIIGAVALIGWTLAKGDTANAGAFFGAGALLLVAGLGLVNVRLANANRDALREPSLAAMAFGGLTRRRSRSVATAAMLASGTFLIVSIGVFRLDANRDATKRTSGTGGFALIGESTMPVVADLNTKAGHESFALNEGDFSDVNFVQFRVRAGDEASCLNLNRAQKPRLLGVKPQSLEGRFTFTRFEKSVFKQQWSLLGAHESDIHPSLLPNEIPAIGDANSIQWAMGKKVGDTLDYVDERGQPFKVRIVGAVANAILQGQLIIDEAEFVKHFPSESGYKYFLIDAPTNRVADVSVKLSRALQDVGLELTPAPQRLAQFNAVQNTYLGTFQILGGLGLLLGSAGLGIVVLRNVLERRGELAVLLAVGWRRSAVNQLVLQEHLALLGLGLALGLVAAIVAVLPSLLKPGTEFPWTTLSLTLAAVLLNGVIWTWLATRAALRGDLLSALRGD